MRKSGFSLTELLLALLISSLLMAGLFRVYLGVKQHTKFLEHRNQLNQEKVLLTHLLRKLIAGAGFMGCSNLSAIPVFNHAKGRIEKSAIKVLKASSAELPGFISKRMKANSKVLTWVQLNFNYSSLSREMVDKTYASLESVDNFLKDKKIIISDCSKAEMSTIKKVSRSHKQLYFSHPLKHTYRAHSGLGYLQRYYLYLSRRQDGYSLSLASANGSVDELSRNITSIEVVILGNLLKLSLKNGDDSTLDIYLALRNTSS